MLPGQNSQVPGMGEEAHKTFDEAKRIYHIGSEVIGEDLAEICFGSQTELLSTSLVQPAIVAAELSNYHMMRQRGLMPNLLMGHSLGEIAALGASEAISVEDTFKVTKTRARVTEESSVKNPGEMAAMVGFRNEQTARILEAANNYLKKVGKGSSGYIANRNWQLEQVLSGHEEAIERVKRIVKMLKTLKIVDRAALIKLKVSGAFHSPHNEDGVAEFKDVLERVDKKIPKVMLLNNQGQYMIDPTLFADYYSGQLVKGVEWQLMMHMAATEGVRDFVEVVLSDEPKKATLTNFIKKEFPDNSTVDKEFGSLVRINWVAEQSSAIIDGLTSLQEA